MAIERLLTGSIRDQVQELMSTEDLVIDAFRDLVKDELKSHIRSKVDQDPELKEEIKDVGKLWALVRMKLYINLEIGKQRSHY